MPPLADGQRERLLVRLSRLQNGQLARSDRHGIGGHARFVMRGPPAGAAADPPASPGAPRPAASRPPGSAETAAGSGAGTGQGPGASRAMVESSSSGTSRPVSASSRERSPPAIWRWACCRAMTAQRRWAMASQKCTAAASMRRPRPAHSRDRIGARGAMPPASSSSAPKRQQRAQNQPISVIGSPQAGELPIENPGEALASTM